MASLNDLQDALVNAHNAGDTKAATALADAIANFDQSPKEDTAAQTRAEYDQLPGWQKPLVAADDMVRKFANGVTFGYADKLAAKTSSGDYEENLKAERQKSREATDRAGSAGLLAEITGAVAGPSALRIPSAMKFIPQGWGLLGRLAAAGVLGAGEGVGYGGLSALGHDTDVKEGMANGAVAGAIAGPAVEGLSSATNALGRYLSGVNRTPTMDDLTRARQAQYADVENRGAMYPADRYRNMVNDLNTDLMNRPHGGIREARHPASFDQMSQFNDTASTVGRDIPLYDLDIDRQVVSRDVMPENSSFGSRMLRGIDDMIGDTTGVTTQQGTPDEAVNSLLSARAANRREKAYGDVAFASEKAERQAARNKRSDGGPIRAKVSSILDNPANSRGFTDDELGLMQQVVDGTKTGNRLRSAADYVGGLTGATALGGAGFSAGSIALGPTVGGPIGAGAGVMASKGMGSGLRALSERSSNRQIDDLLHLIATGRRLETGKTPGRGMSRGSEQELERLLLMMQNQGNEKKRSD